ncbi:DUF6179 domain-containing protein [Cellulosilyticum ruminicola]|uniref:DUF6179 domain-containing protein n=1 Tax=Cellulosilyticum ruminicola TaxID=425254 RepID=UPI0006D14796|nr:DUF6179 domain-containing protein [Cellulosilyticum ruminicola]
MNTSLTKASRMDRSRILSHNYTQTYIEEAARVGLLTPLDVTNLQLSLVKLLERQIQRYTRFESSSVKVETAEGLMRSILYALDVRLKQLKGEIEEGVTLLKEKTLETLFIEGFNLINEKFNKCKTYFQKVKETRLKVDNYAYNDTMEYAFTEFFGFYEAEFSYQSPMPDIDYPLCIDDMQEENTDYIYMYLKKLYHENLFCNSFPVAEIQTLLDSSHPHQSEMLINIFEYVLINAIGRQLANKDLKHLELSEGDCQSLQMQFETQLDIQMLVEEAVNEIIKSLHVVGFLKHYMLEALPPIVKRIKANVENDTLNQIFIPFKLGTKVEKVHFTDGESLEDERFKKMIEAVCSSQLVVEKLMIFKENVHSLKDTIDFLEAECLFGKEYRALYKSLSLPEISLLLKYTSISDEQSFKTHLQEVQNDKSLLKPWEMELVYFLANKEAAQRAQLWLVVQNINV